MNQVFLLKLKCFAENLFCWKTPNHLSLSYSHREEMGCLQPLLPLLMFQPSCASPCTHSRSFSQSTHLLNGPNILYWDMYEIFKQYEEEETVLLNKRETHSISVWWECITNWTGDSACLFWRTQVTSIPEMPVCTGIFDTLWMQTLVKHFRAREKPITSQTHP